jgi:hypothetical protein
MAFIFVPMKNDRMTKIKVPNIPLILMAPTIAHGTAIAAFVLYNSEPI